MRILAVAFLLGLTTLLAHAESIAIDKPVICMPVKILLSNLKDKFGEEPMVVGHQENTDITMAVYVNQQKGTFTLIEFDDQIGCVLSAGKNVRYRFPKGTPLT